MLSFKPQIAKVAKPREFSYIPRYYDERKEKIAEIERKIREKEENVQNGDRKVREFHFRRAMSNRWRGEEYDGAARKSNLVIMVIVVALIFMGYYIMKYTHTLEYFLQDKL